MYADDLLLISASLDTLQKMIDLCAVEVLYVNTVFNAKKSMVTHIGQRSNRECASVLLNGVKLSFAYKAKYLDVFISSSRKFKISLDEPIVN
jgi:hypothetical protein